MKLNINLRNGILVYDDFNINPDIPLQEQVFELGEDLLQIQYENNIVIDVGWYPGFDPLGNFTIYIIKDCDWDHPLYKKVVKLKNIAAELQKAIDLIPRLNS